MSIQSRHWNSNGSGRKHQNQWAWTNLSCRWRRTASGSHIFDPWLMKAKLQKSLNGCKWCVNEDGNQLLQRDFLRTNKREKSSRNGLQPHVNSKSPIHFLSCAPSRISMTSLRWLWDEDDEEQTRKITRIRVSVRGLRWLIPSTTLWRSLAKFRSKGRWKNTRKTLSWKERVTLCWSGHFRPIWLTIHYGLIFQNRSIWQHKKTTRKNRSGSTCNLVDVS